jgi:hypothetical protein
MTELASKVVKFSLLSILLTCLYGCTVERQDAPQQRSQYPSPMADAIRSHERTENKSVPGLAIQLKNVLTKPVKIYAPEMDRQLEKVDLLIHFHGASFVPERAVYDSGHPFILATVNLGSGSSVYEKPFESKHAFTELVEAVIDSVREKKSIELEVSRIYLSSFSAGYGAVRAILRNHQERVDGIILLDGLHTDYVPARKVLAEGGKLNEKNLTDFVQFARLAIEGRKKFLITHSAIFPGTYASTTETADFIINSLGLKRQPALKWGPGGMQLVSKTYAGNLAILGFAGNTAPDHIDHFHGLPYFLKMILDEQSVKNERNKTDQTNARPEWKETSQVSQRRYPCGHPLQKKCFPFLYC